MLELENRPSIARVDRIVRDLLELPATAPAVPPDGDLSDLGLTSEGMINLVLSLEAEFDIAIPGSKFAPANFRTITRITALVDELMA